MGEKTAGVGHFTIPTAPAAGTSCTSGAANVFTTTYVQLIASTSAALFITGIYVEEAAASAATYIVVQLATGGAGSETVVGQYLIPPSTGSTVTRSYRPIYPPIPVANATRIACKTADSVGAAAKLITLECIAQSNVVDDGVAVATVTTVTNRVTANVDQVDGAALTAHAAGKMPADVLNVAGTVQTAGDLKASMNTLQADTDDIQTRLPAALVGGRMDSSTGAMAANVLTATAINADAITAAKVADGTIDAATFAAGAINAAAIAADAITDAKVAADVTIASVTGAVGSVTAAVLLPTIPNNWISAAGIAAGALNGKGDWLLSSGYTAPLTAATTRAAVGLASANLDTQLAALDTDILTRLATASYTAPPSTASIADKILGRNLAGGLDGGRTMADAMRALRNKTSLAAGVLTVYAEDDTTPAWTAAVAQAARDPITSVDPT